MKKNLAILASLLVVFLTLLSVSSCNKDDDDNNNPNDPNTAKITATTEKVKGDSLYIYYSSANPIQVDWGDGNKITTVANATVIGNTLKGNTIKIYSENASDISYVDLGSSKLTALDIRNAIGLKALDIYYNKLTSLDLSKNSNLLYADISGNMIKQTAMNKVMNDLPTRIESDAAKIWVIDASYSSEQNEAPSSAAQTVAQNKKWSLVLEKTSGRNHGKERNNNK